jgi:purine-binding chemotaxis protein CheW
MSKGDAMAKEEIKSKEEEYLYDELEEDTQKDKFLTFRIGDEGYGIAIGFIMEIIGMQKVTKVPDTADYVKGVINLRGQVIPVMDVRLRFGLKERDYDERTCIVVVKIDAYSVGLIVDTVSEVVDIPEDSISPKPSIGKEKTNAYIQGMGKLENEVKIILDVQKLLFDEELQKLSKES